MKKLTTKEFFGTLPELLKENIEIVGEYTGIKNPITVRCLKCGTETTITRAENLRRNQENMNCCKIPHNSISREEAQRRLDERIGKDKLFILQFESMSKPVTLKCLRCNDIRYLSAGANMNQLKRGCPHCDAWQSISKEEAQQRINELWGENEFTLVEYKRAEDKILLKHKCGFAFSKSRLNDIMKMRGCPSCEKSLSKMESTLSKLLQKWKIDYQKEFIFEDLRGDKLPLRFDFAIFNNKKFIGVIEAQGKQHYEPGWGGEEALIKRKEYDEKKVNYCKINNIPLLVIPYWEAIHIKKKLKNFLELNDYPLGEYTSSEVETLDT